MPSELLIEHVGRLSLKDLRALIGEAGLATDGCIDKSDLRARALEAAERLKAPGAKVRAPSRNILPCISQHDARVHTARRRLQAAA